MGRRILKGLLVTVLATGICLSQVIGAFAGEEVTTYVPVSKININKVTGVVKTTRKIRVFKKSTLKGKTVATYKKGKKIAVIKTKGKVATVKIGKKKYFCNVKYIQFKKPQVGKSNAMIDAFEKPSMKAKVFATAPKGTQMVLEGKKGNFYNVVLVKNGD